MRSDQSEAFGRGNTAVTKDMWRVARRCDAFRQPDHGAVGSRGGALARRRRLDWLQGEDASDVDRALLQTSSQYVLDGNATKRVYDKHGDRIVSLDVVNAGDILYVSSDER